MKTKWGVWGSGGIARRRTIPEGIARAGAAEVTHVYCRTDDVNREVAATFGARACADESELLASDCDVIYIATPVDLHVEEVTRCAEAGKHVFCEKPLGRTVDEAQGIVSACRSHGVKLGVGLMMRFHAQHAEALRMVTAGRIGAPVLGRAQLSCWYPPIEGAWRQDPARGGGGSLMDMGSHCIDLLEMFLGRTLRVRCMIDSLVHDYASEDTAVVALEFETGAKGVVDVLFNVPDASSRNRLELYGSRGSILAEGTIGQGEAGEMVACLEEGEGGYDAQQSRDSSGGIRIAPDPVNMYRGEVEAFAQAVLDDTDPPVDGEAGLWNQRVVAAAYESAQTGKAVTV
mgnify:FL=1